MEEHPLLNSVVLQEVFCYLKTTATLETVKTLRQVCRVWRDESLDWWRKEAVLKVEPEEKNGVSDEKQLMDLLQDPYLFYCLEDKPFQNIKLKKFTVNLANAFEEGTDANALWKLVGKHVKHLELSAVNIELGGRPLEQVRELEHALIHFLLKHFSKFESFTGQWTSLDGVPMDKILEDSGFLELKLPKLVSLKCNNFYYFHLSNLPNLQSLAVSDCDLFVKMLKGATTSTEDGQMVIPGLKELSLDMDQDLFSACSNESGVTIRSLRFPSLRRLKLSFKKNKRDNCYKALQVLMENHSQQLEVLEVFIAPFVRSEEFIPFECKFDNLVELRILGNAVRCMDFLAWTHRLRVLHLDGLCMEKMEELQGTIEKWAVKKYIHWNGPEVQTMNKDLDDLISLDNLEYLQIDGLMLYDYRELYMWWKVERWLDWTGLKTLRTDLIPGSISAICVNWPDLERLEGLHGSDVWDEDITGELGESLSDLGNLKSFHYKPLCDKSRLTDAVVPVFVKMDQLTDLQICVSKEFTPEAEQRLKDWMGPKGIVRIVRNYTGNKEHVGWQCCKEKEFLDFLDPEDKRDDATSTDEEYSSASDFSDSELESWDDEDGWGSNDMDSGDDDQEERE